LILGNFVHNGDVNEGLSEDLQAELGTFVHWPTYQSTSDGVTGPDDWISSKLIPPYPKVEQEPIDQYCSFWDEIGYDFKLFGSGFADSLKDIFEESDLPFTVKLH